VFPAVGVLEWTADGVLLRGQADSLAWFAQELARLPFAFEIRRPVALRQELEALARRLLAIATDRPGAYRPVTSKAPGQ
jgi:hypothetical protein